MRPHCQRHPPPSSSPASRERCTTALPRTRHEQPAFCIIIGRAPPPPQHTTPACLLREAVADSPSASFCPCDAVRRSFQVDGVHMYIYGIFLPLLLAPQWVSQLHRHLQRSTYKAPSNSAFTCVLSRSFLSPQTLDSLFPPPLASRPRLSIQSSFFAWQR